MSGVREALRAPFADSLGALGEVLRNAGLRRLQVAYVASLVGLWSYAVAIAVYAYDVGGAALVGVAALLRLLPAAVAAPFAALLADRYQRRLVLLATDLVRALLVGGSAVAVAAGATPAIVLVLAGVVTVVSTAFEPAKNSLVPALTREPDQLTAANVVTSGFESASLFLGPALGGVLVAAASVEVSFVVTAALLTASFGLIALIEEPRRDPPVADGTEEGASDSSAGGMREELLAGARAVAADRRLTLVVGLLAAQIVVDGALGVLVVVLALELLDMGAGGVGLLNAAVGVGGLIGTLVALRLTGRRGLGAALGVGIVGWGAPLALVGLAPEAAVAVAMLLVIGVANTVVDASGLTLLQRIAPEKVLGRVLGSLETLFIGAAAIGSVAAPALIAVTGARGALVATGLFLPLLALAARAGLRRLDADLPVPGPELALLREVSMFAPLPPPTLERLAGQLRSRRVQGGDDVIRQGQVADRFYVIARGEVEVFEDGVNVRREGPGDYFGEIGLIRRVPRTATVTAATDLQLYALEGDDFIAAVTGHAPSAESADAVIATRLGSARASASIA